MKILPLILLCSLFLFSSCNRPLDKIYSPQTFEEDVQLLRSTKMEETDIDLLTKFILVSKLAGNDLAGEKYCDILERVKSIQLSNDQHSERDQKLMAAKIQRLQPYIKVSLVSKHFTRLKDHDYLTYDITFKNLSPSAIKTVTGTMNVNDLLDKQIKNISILLDEQINAKSLIQKTFNVLYNHADVQDQRIRSKDLSAMRVVWNPDKIIFEDGTLAE
ncbi:MAG: hypothetical protein ABJA57_02755 [Ginsengibacter sp.]